MSEHPKSAVYATTPTLEPTFEGLINLTVAYSEALLLEVDLQKKYNEAASLAQYRRDDIALSGYLDGIINGANERMKKLQELRIVAHDRAAAYLELYEDQAFKALTLATVERKRIEAEISLTKAWLYSQSGSNSINNYNGALG